MTYNTLAYIIYIPIVFFITIKIGWVFYNNGAIVLKSFFKNDPNLISSVNTLLLIGYYLVNLGAAVYSIAYWKQLNNAYQMLSTLTEVIGSIMFFLAILHYNNIFWIIRLSKKQY